MDKELILGGPHDGEWIGPPKDYPWIRLAVRGPLHVFDGEIPMNAIPLKVATYKRATWRLNGSAVWEWAE